MEAAAAGSEESGAAEGPVGTAAGREDGGCEGLWELPVEHCVRRAECGRCRRPQKVCLCPFFPVHPLKVSTCLYIIQHPAEESRVLRTVPLLTACLPGDKCKVLIGRRFGEDRYPELAAVCRNSNTLILYPGAEAANLEEVALIFPSPSTIIIIDGTWSQAKDIFYKNSLFRLPKQTGLAVQLRFQGRSRRNKSFLHRLQDTGATRAFPQVHSCAKICIVYDNWLPGNKTVERYEGRCN
ncbi:tRNA-uridine aminocarboxypropyltransferase 2 isoform X3 [Lepidochelys kempii]|uniref:tRNA-uridine aminocarboxypropyltransferase 2 isoform X3 n=1 Tax=Lepidochelys kempii TaxID=8472 RepID=UPI003C6F0617